MQREIITLDLVNGEPQGLRIASISNWNGKAFTAPREDIKPLLAREEMTWPGVYFLFEQDTQTGESIAYIGVAKSVRKRLPNHREKDWTHVIIFVSQSLHEGHVKFLEGLLLEEARKAKRMKVTNDKGSGSPLPEHERASMEYFIGRIRLLLPILGCELLVPLKKTAKGDGLICKIKGLIARGERSPRGFVVFKGSQAIRELRHSAKTRGGWIIKLRSRLEETNVLVSDGDHLCFAKDWEFESPSAAAAVIRGGNANGLTEWRSKDGKKLKELDADN